MPALFVKPTAVAGLLLTTATLAAQQPALRGLDPVQLCNGKERQGRAEFAATHEGYTYCFANRQSRETFRRNPQRYAIQLAGGCGRMGPLSGRGDQDRFLVHEGRIYIFASEPCREGFAKDPAACLARDEPKPKTIGKPGFDGSTLLAAVRKAHGADKPHTLSFATKSEKGKLITHRRYLVRDPESVRVETDYVQGEKIWKYVAATSPKASFLCDEGETRVMSAAGRQEMLRDLWREPCVTLHRCKNAVLGKKTKVTGLEIQQVHVWIDGSLTTFGVNERNRIRTVQSRSRGPDQRFHEITLRYDDYRVIDGVLIATSVQTFLDGKELPEQLQRRLRVKIGDAIADDLFSPPK